MKYTLYGKTIDIGIILIILSSYVVNFIFMLNPMIAILPILVFLNIIWDYQVQNAKHITHMKFLTYLLWFIFSFSLLDFITTYLSTHNINYSIELLKNNAANITFVISFVIYSYMLAEKYRFKYKKLIKKTHPETTVVFLIIGIIIATINIISTLSFIHKIIVIASMLLILSYSIYLTYLADRAYSIKSQINNNKEQSNKEFFY